LGDENVLELDCGGGCTTKSHGTVSFKRVDFMVYELHLNRAPIKGMKTNKDGVIFAFSSSTETGI
jgi:hypothetical protein